MGKFFLLHLRKYISKYLAIILLPAVCWLFTNALVFQHSHILANGEIITHAHPYTPDKNNHTPFQSHKHSAKAFFILGQLSSPSTLLVIFTAALSLFLAKLYTISINYSCNIPRKDYSYYGIYRAPPFLA
ncbi:MAG: hypothetical protein Q8862_03740 [Bacteroidota bacterium]|nr:hypothetical protein [Bacteroidota bacterium]